MAKYKFQDIAINCTAKKVPSEDEFKTYIGLEHMDSHCIFIKRWGSEVPIIGEKLIMHKGDVLLGKRNAYLRRAAIAPHDGVFSAHGMVLRPKTEVIDEKFFPLFIASDYFFDEAIKISVGSLSPTINWKDLKEVEFELPSMEEQRKLADILWAIEETKESYSELVSRTDDLVKSQFIEMFGNINDQRFETQKWKDVVSVINGKDHKSISGSGPYGVYGTGGRMMNATQYMCEENTIIMGRKGTIDKPFICHEKAWVVDTAFAVIPKTNRLHYMYLFWYTKLIDYGKLNKAAVLPSIVKSDLLELEIQIPPKELQERFVDFVEQTDKSKYSEEHWRLAA